VQQGFTYLWLLAAIAVLGIGLAEVSEVWASSARRQRIAQLEWIGAQFTSAIGSYYQSAPDGAKAYPAELQDLVEDRRFPMPRRHLRTVYANPFSGKPDWALVTTPDKRIRGVRASVPGEDGAVVREFVYVPTSVAP